MLATGLCAAVASTAQELPQSNRPAETPERQREIRDSIRERGRVHFERDAEEGAEQGDGARALAYRPDRALLMPRMERTAIFRIGVPGWLMRVGLRAGRDDFDSEEEYRATREILRGVRAVRVAAYANNGAFDADKLLRHYLRYAKRKRGEPVLQVRAPGGGVQIHVKERRGTVRLITLLAYGDEGAAVIRLKSRFKERHLRRALEYMVESADEELGVRIDAEQ